MKLASKANQKESINTQIVNKQKRNSGKNDVKRKEKEQQR